MEITLEKVKDYASKAFYGEIPEAITNKIGFEFEGIWITTPWMDDSARFELTDNQAIELYGTENVESYISKAKEYLEGKSTVCNITLSDNLRETLRKCGLHFGVREIFPDGISCRMVDFHGSKIEEHVPIWYAKPEENDEEFDLTEL